MGHETERERETTVVVCVVVWEFVEIIHVRIEVFRHLRGRSNDLIH